MVFQPFWNWLLGRSQDDVPLSWQSEWSSFLLDYVAFYRVLSDEDKRIFEERCLLFIKSTRIEAGAFVVSDQDRLLVAASAVILARQDD